MDARFELFHGDEKDVVILTATNEVKHGVGSSKTNIMAEPYKRKYKNHKSAVKKFLYIVERIINDEERTNK